jgi:hypothetical protein
LTCSEATCLILQEIDAPPGVTPIAGRLLTNRAMSTLEEAAQLISWSRALGHQGVVLRA